MNLLHSFAAVLFCGFLGCQPVSTSKPPGQKCEAGKLYFKETGTCYGYGVQGPCHESMVTNIDTSVGTDNGKCFCKNDESPFCASRPKLYFPARHQCYNIYSRGPCRKGEWFVEITTEKYPPEGVCQPNPCKNITTRQPKRDPVFIYLHEGKCYQTSTRGHCENPSEVSYFTSTTALLCGPPKNFQAPCEQQILGSVAFTGSLNCPNGQVKNGAGECSASAQIR